MTTMIQSWFSRLDVWLVVLVLIVLSGIVYARFRPARWSVVFVWRCESQS